MITKEQADLIVANNKEFQVKEDVVDGFKVVQYRYRLASKKDFEKPFEGSAVDANELRGLLFVEQDDGAWKRFLMLRKFWEVNQTEGQMEKDLRSKKIIDAKIKEDGSIIRFFKLPNKHISPKSMFSVDGVQVNAARKIFNDNKNLRSFVEECLDENIAAIFELVGPSNQVVLKYDEESLRLLQIRDEESGEYLNIDGHPLVEKYSPRMADSCKVVDDLSYYMDLAKTERGHEGYVLTFDDQTLSKVKLDEYHHMHGIINTMIGKEHKIIRLILMDPLPHDESKYSSFARYMEITNISDSERRRAYLIKEKLTDFIQSEISRAMEILSLLDDLDRKESAIHPDVINFRHKGIVMRAKATGDHDIVAGLIISGCLKDCKTGEKASSFINKTLGLPVLEKEARFNGKKNRRGVNI